MRLAPTSLIFLALVQSVSIACFQTSQSVREIILDYNKNAAVKDATYGISVENKVKAMGTAGVYQLVDLTKSDKDDSVVATAILFLKPYYSEAAFSAVLTKCRAKNRSVVGSAYSTLAWWQKGGVNPSDAEEARNLAERSLCSGNEDNFYSIAHFLGVAKNKESVPFLEQALNLKISMTARVAICEALLAIDSESAKSVLLSQRKLFIEAHEFSTVRSIDKAFSK